MICELRYMSWVTDNVSDLKQMKIIAVYTQLKQLRNKAWKKFRPERESNPWPLRYRCSALTNWAIKPTGSWSIVSSLYTHRWRRCDKNTWKSVILCKAWDVFFGYFGMEKKNTSPSACCSLGNYRPLILKSLSWKILSVIENLIIYFNFIDCNFLFFLQRYHPK